MYLILAESGGDVSMCIVLDYGASHLSGSDNSGHSLDDAELDFGCKHVIFGPS